MLLSDFITEQMEAILSEWESFAAAQLPAAADMTSLALRDHAPDILEAIARDLTTPQTREEQSEKSKGRAPVEPNAPETAAQTHAILRARSGFEINQLVAEYRALRASVLRLWSESNPGQDLDVEDIIRFNEAIDQAVAESVSHFHSQMTRFRNLFLGMLGHDMRTPLNSIVATASYLAALNAGEKVSEAAKRLIRSGGSMQALLDDLVDFNRTQLGLGVKVIPTEIDLAASLTDEVEQLRAAHPDRDIELEIAGECRGQWDGARLNQVLRNLVENAMEYGSPDTPVRVAIRGDESGVRIAVSNSGSDIDPSVREQVFDPLKRGLEHGGNHGDGNLGLGLFVVQEIVRAHDGQIDMRSSDGETTFTVHLPHQK